MKTRKEIILLPKIQYRTTRTQKKILALIQKANEIIDEFKELGYDSIALRQLFYQFVSRNIIQNNQNEYDNLCNTIKNGRYRGLIDWESIVDRTRSLRELSHWDSPADILESAAQSYRIDLWNNQDVYLECWTEKDAVLNVVQQAAERYDVPYFSCRGFNSASEMWQTAQRIISRTANGKECILLYMGDFDPSGAHMSNDIFNRLEEFGAKFKFDRIALNKEQVDKYELPPQRVKADDTRTPKFVEKHGNQCYELDALPPLVLDKLISDNITKHLDIDKFNQSIFRQDSERAMLRELIDSIK